VGAVAAIWPRSDSDKLIFIFFPFHQLWIFFSKLTKLNFGWDRSAEAVVAICQIQFWLGQKFAICQIQFWLGQKFAICQIQFWLGQKFAICQIQFWLGQTCGSCGGHLARTEVCHLARTKVCHLARTEVCHLARTEVCHLAGTEVGNCQSQIQTN